MSTRPADWAFGVSGPQWRPHSEAPTPDIADQENAEAAEHAEAAEQAEAASGVTWVNTELHDIASTIEELQSRLEEANSRLSTVQAVETTEFEIGRLFIEAQRFSEASLSNLEARLHEVLSAAESKAMQILAEATEEAREIRREAQQAAFASTATVRELQSAITGFTSVNSELLKELGTLNNMLTPGSMNGAVEGAVETDSSSLATEHPIERA